MFQDVFFGFSYYKNKLLCLTLCPREVSNYTGKPISGRDMLSLHLPRTKAVPRLHHPRSMLASGFRHPRMKFVLPPPLYPASHAAKRKVRFTTA
jgi:hypothetical protein